MRDFHLNVLTDCGVGSSLGSHANALRAMAHVQGRALLTAAAFVG